MHTPKFVCLCWFGSFNSYYSKCYCLYIFVCCGSSWSNYLPYQAFLNKFKKKNKNTENKSSKK